MALDDLVRAKRYANKMLEIEEGKAFSEERIIYEALSLALVISYGRVFNKSNTIDNKFKEKVSQSFGDFRCKVISSLSIELQNLNKRLKNERDSSVAHSDAKARNYMHPNNSQLSFGRNPYYPKEKDEVKNIVLIIETLIHEIGNEQSQIKKRTFKNDVFGIPF